MNTWMRQTDLHYQLVEIKEEERLDGFPKILNTVIAFVKYNRDSQKWDVNIYNEHITHLETLQMALNATEYLVKQMPNRKKA